MPLINQAHFWRKKLSNIVTCPHRTNATDVEKIGGKKRKTDHLSKMGHVVFWWTLRNRIFLCKIASKKRREKREPTYFSKVHSVHIKELKLMEAFDSHC